MSDLDFYKQLESIKTIKERRELISQLLKNSELASLFGEGVKNARLLEDLAIPSDPMNKLSLPFAVGFKYKINKLHDEGFFNENAYLLRIVRFPSGGENFLTVCDDGMFYCLHRYCLINPFFT